MPAKKLPEDALLHRLIVEEGLGPAEVRDWLKEHRGIDVTAPSISMWRRRAGLPPALPRRSPWKYLPGTDHGGTAMAQAVRAYYRDIFIPSWPDDLQTKLVNRIMGEDQLVDELHMVFTHDRAMEWLLPGVAPTHRTIEMDVVAVVQFRDGELAAERIYWDQAAVLRQAGLLQD